MNKQTKHTPGPWKLSTKRYEGKRGVMMATETPGLNILVADVLEDADARLIAAAPYLLKTAIEALQIWDDLYSGMCQKEGDEGEREVFGALRSAIREAQGEG